MRLTAAARRPLWHSGLGLGYVSPSCCLLTDLDNPFWAGFTNAAIVVPARRLGASLAQGGSDDRHGGRRMSIVCAPLMTSSAGFPIALRGASGVLCGAAWCIHRHGVRQLCVYSGALAGYTASDNRRRKTSARQEGRSSDVFLLGGKERREICIGICAPACTAGAPI